jgi:DNA-binding GntR family transcriptional regulator
LDALNFSSWTRSPTSEQLVTDKLRKHIMANELPVGEFLSQRKLADLTESSIISVRGALRQLENEGLVENVPRMGVRVPQESRSALRDRYFIRKVLETAAVEQFCAMLSEEVKDNLMRMAKELDRMAEEHTVESQSEFAHLHHQFHLFIAQTASSPLLTKLVRRVINPSLMALNATQSWETRSESIQIHTRLAECLVGGNVKMAIRAIQEHIRVGLENELADLQ